MSRRVILSPDAEADIIAIQRWYRSKEASLAFAFKVELRLTLRFIAQYPYAFTVVRKGHSARIDEGFSLPNSLQIEDRVGLCYSCSSRT